MSLDQNLFTLLFAQNKDDPNVLELADPSGIVHYRRHRIPGQTYKIELYDPGSEALLATASSVVGTGKHKTLELYNPTTVIELKYTGTLTFRWSFKWEDHDYEWKKEECYMLRKPDPPVMVAVTKDGGKSKATSVQILDYNLNRFDINDRKGLEIVILTALLTFQDFNVEAARSKKADNQPVASPTTGPVMAPNIPFNTTDLSPPPPPPPKPAPKTGIDRIAEIQALRGEINEVVVEDEGTIPDYAQYCFNLLQDDAMLFITVKSAGAEQVPKVLQVVEEVKRLRHKEGLGDSELHQYVLYDVEKPKGPKRINLDDNSQSQSKAKYQPPSNLTIHLSKIDMPELRPKPQRSERKNEEASRRGKKEKNLGHQSHDNSSASPSLAVPKPTNLLKSRKVSSPDVAQTNAKPTHPLNRPHSTDAGSAIPASFSPNNRHSTHIQASPYSHPAQLANPPVPPQAPPQRSPASGVAGLFGVFRR